MTTAAETASTTKEEAIKQRNEEMAAEEVKLNAGKTGKGTRTFLGMTRGRNPQKIQYENWDESQPETLPLSLSEFMDLRKLSDEPSIVRRLILGDNEIFYSEASDPVAEFVDSSWSEDVQKGFRAVVRNYSANVGVSIEDAANLIKPAYLASQAKK